MNRPTSEEKLTALLAAMGIAVDSFNVARGYWTHRHQDCMRWQARVRIRGGSYVTIGSWDNLRDCARRGITFEPNKGPGPFDTTGGIVSAKPRRSGAK